MPIFPDSFHDDFPPPVSTTTMQAPTTAASSLNHRTSDESIRTDLCEGPVPDDHQQEPPLQSRMPQPELELVKTTSDRAELIERLKRGESPTWVAMRKLDALYPRNGSCDRSRAASPRRAKSPPSTTVDEATQEADHAAEQRLQQGLNIERPRSALHSGDFTQHTSTTSRTEGSTRRAADTEDYHQERHSWFATSPPRDHFAPFTFEKRVTFPELSDGYTRSSPSSLSSSLSSNFVFKHPTSPLVQSESNDDSSIHSMDLDPSTPIRPPRRQTLHSYHSSMSHSSTVPPVTAQRIPTVRRESTFPYQAHQPRKSLTSVPNNFWTGTSPGSSRRTSVGWDLSSSPLQQTSMVGSYEESILRGRMSTTPSKPLDFLAQIGVLGLGTNCKSSLRCPAHVTLPFPAVFYSYASTPHGRSQSNNGDDGPSPYVGQIDLENGLPNPDETRARLRSHQRRASRKRESSVDLEMTDGMEAPITTTTTLPDARDIAKQRRRTGSGPKAPPGGSYRIPEKGQLQIIIKNQNKTAVKLFLVPYDLAGMEPGTKTFIRQRSYSGAPTNVDGVPVGEHSATADKPVLRYLVHLHICCPARGRFYLYKSIRVVFANRVPDGKEKLRNEVTLPEPKFTPYKPIRMMHPPVSAQLANGPGASLAAEKAFRRRSSGFSFGSGVGGATPTGGEPDFLSGLSLRARASSVQDRGAMLGRPIGHTVGGRSLHHGQVQLPFTVVERSPPTSAPAVTSAPHPSVVSSSFTPLHFAKGEVDAAVAEGLLSQRLRSLGMGIGGQRAAAAAAAAADIESEQRE